MPSDLNNKKFIIAGFTAGFSLLVLYFIVLSLVNSFSHALEQFSQLWYWILVLVAGFGLQVGLYFYIRDSIRQKQMKNPTAAVAASGGISTGSMIACCFHHLVDVLPLMGLAAAAVFLTKYQILFLIVGILSNLIGIVIMLEIIQKYRLSQNQNVLRYNIGFIKKIFIVASIPVLLITFLLVSNKPVTVASAINPFSQTDNQNGISFEATPIEFRFNEPVKFEIKIDTHSGSLDFDLTKISILEDNNGNQYQPLEWQGFGQGSHHLAGILIFPKLGNQVKLIKLIIKDIPPRTFEWNLE